MTNGKHAPSSRRRNHRPLALILSLVLVLGLVIGGTVAYLVTRTDPVNNTFTPAHVSCVVETTGKGVQVKNTGNIDAWIRVYVTANYVNSAGNVCAAHAVTAPTPSADWTLQGDFYYYNQLVPSNGVTPVLFENIPQDTAGDNCTLKIEVVASAIQPGTEAGNAWRGTRS